MEKRIKRPRRVVVAGIAYIQVYIGDENQFLKNRNFVLKLKKPVQKTNNSNLGEFARTKMQMSN